MMVRIANGLISRGYSISLIVVDGAGELKDDLDPRIDYLDLRCRRVRFAFLKILWALRRSKPSLVLSTLTRLNVLLLLIKPLIQPIVVIREAATLSQQRGITRILYRLLCPYADRIVIPRTHSVWP